MAEIKITIGVKPERESRGIRYRGIASVGNFDIETPMTYSYSELAKIAVKTQAEELRKQLEQGRLS